MLPRDPESKPGEIPGGTSGVVLGGGPPDGLSSLATNWIVTEIPDAARQSAASGKTIRLPEVP